MQVGYEMFDACVNVTLRENLNLFSETRAHAVPVFY